MTDSRIDAIKDDPSRFLAYLTKEDEQFVKRGKTQQDRILRLKQRFESFFTGEVGKQGEHFMDNQKGGNLATDPEYDDAMATLYNLFSEKALTARERRETIKEGIHLRKTGREVGKVLKQAPPFKKLKLKIIKTKKGVVRKLWTKQELDYLRLNKNVRSNIFIQKNFKLLFGTKRSASSISTKKSRIKKKRKV